MVSSCVEAARPGEVKAGSQVGRPSSGPQTYTPV